MSLRALFLGYWLSNEKHESPYVVYHVIFCFKCCILMSCLAVPLANLAGGQPGHQQLPSSRVNRGSVSSASADLRRRSGAPGLGPPAAASMTGSGAGRKGSVNNSMGADVDVLTNFGMGPKAGFIF